MDWRKDIDVGVNRSQKDLENWMKRDPILRLKESLLDFSVLSTSDVDQIYTDIQNNINASWDRALKDPYPENSELLSRVYAND